MNVIPHLEKIRDCLTKNNLKISTAESCTGGLVSSYLTDITGASAYIEQNFVTYSNEAKAKFLGVKKQTLDTFGAVSEQVAWQMALGLIKYADCSIATTGLLGPTGGSEEKPIGLCYMGFGYKPENQSKEIIKVVKFLSPIADKEIDNKRIKIKIDIAQNAIINFENFIYENLNC